MLFRTHPGYDQLSRLADGELPPAEAMEVNGHLAQCERCREEVDFMAELRERLRELAVPAPPSGLLPEILERREAGERTVLPLAAGLEDDVRWRNRKGAAIAVIVMAALAVTTFFVFRPQSIRAGSTSFEVEMRDAGRPVSVSYRTAGALAGESILRVRAEYFAPGELELGSVEPGTMVEGDLRARGDGEFRGEVLLPSTVAYARFVVEDYRGEIVDRDFAERWEYLARNAEGEPTFDALWQRTLALEEVAPREALESARRLTERYPDRPEGWTYRLANGGGPEAVPDAPLPATFVDRLPAHPRPDELAAVAEYASQLGAEDVHDELLARIESIDPRHPMAVDARVSNILRDLGSNPPQLLAALEREWLDYGQPQLILLAMGLDFALQADSPDAVLRWADRWVAADPGAAAYVAATVGRLPSLRPAAIRRLRRALDRADAPHTRALGERRSDRRRTADRSRAELLASLGRLLYAEGETESAAEALARAAAHRWDPETAALLVSVSDELGRPEIADRYRMLRAVDPLLDEAARRRIIAGLRAGSADLDRRMRQARLEMLDRLGSTRDRIFPSGPIRVTSLDGGPRDLAARLGHAPTLVQFWSPLLPSSVERLEGILDGCDRFSEAGIRVIAVSVDPVQTAQLPEGAETCQGFEALVDPDREARLSLRTESLGEAVLVDDTGQVRVRFRSDDDAVRAALILAIVD